MQISMAKAYIPRNNAAALNKVKNAKELCDLIQFKHGCFFLSLLLLFVQFNKECCLVEGRLHREVTLLPNCKCFVNTSGVECSGEIQELSGRQVCGWVDADTHAHTHAHTHARTHTLTVHLPLYAFIVIQVYCRRRKFRRRKISYLSVQNLSYEIYFRILSEWPKKNVKTRWHNRKACKSDGRKFGMKVNFVLFSIIRKLFALRLSNGAAGDRRRQMIEWLAAQSFFPQKIEWKFRIPKTVGNRKRDCAWGYSRWFRLPNETKTPRNNCHHGLFFLTSLTDMKSCTITATSAPGCHKTLDVRFFRTFSLTFQAKKLKKLSSVVHGPFSV